MFIHFVFQVSFCLKNQHDSVFRLLTINPAVEKILSEGTMLQGHTIADEQLKQLMEMIHDCFSTTLEHVHHDAVGASS